MKRLSESFGAVAEAYDRGRPSYPADAVAWLLDGDAKIVLELGAGTGKLTREMVDQGHAVFATEKDPAMLEVLQQRVPEVSAKVAGAEEIPANDRSVDVVVAAQAFHWFDHELAIPEMARVLKPGGHVALVWNFFDKKIPWVRKLVDVVGGGAGIGIAGEQDAGPFPTSSRPSPTSSVRSSTRPSPSGRTSIATPSSTSSRRAPTSHPCPTTSARPGSTPCARSTTTTAAATTACSCPTSSSASARRSSTSATRQPKCLPTHHRRVRSFRTAPTQTCC
ncbi:class I SAM-dependent methyltransferase [Nocardioides sp. B-3]|uniref:class I SAM-dependent methyltransferase n=1 Tax=Nocardioides sp. B-3 TaxID=2895565 RepID=UPI003FA575CB